jgi:hypothetical protein
MSVRLAKPWRPLDAASLASVPATVGVYEIADERGVVADIGFAGGRSLFGLRGELSRWLAGDGHWQFRCEVTSQYLSRYTELLMVHVADHGSLPERVARRGEHPAGRLSPQGAPARPDALT